MRNCPHCDEEINSEMAADGICSKCGQEISYGSNGCG